MTWCLHSIWIPYGARASHMFALVVGGWGVIDFLGPFSKLTSNFTHAHCAEASKV